MNRPTQHNTHKKVTKACNTCRLKRKKCDGLHPCSFCTENEVECSYSGEPKRRGPPSGYLRYTETRVALLEVLLGLFISRTSPTSKRRNIGTTDSDPFEDAAQTLLAESKHCTQDVWDRHRDAWITCRSVKIIDELASTFAPYNQRRDHEVAPKPLLPLPTPDGPGRSPDAHPLPPTEPLASPSVTFPGFSPAARSATSDSSPAPSPIHALVETEHEPLRTHLISKESFERYTATTIQRPLRQSPPILEVPALTRGIENGSKTGRNTAFSIASLIDGDQFDGGRHESMVIPEEVDQHATINRSAVQELNYGSVYWRSSSGSAPAQDPTGDRFNSRVDSPVARSLELPPPNVLSNMIDIYYNVVWPTFPLLPTRPTLETLLSSIPVHSDAFTTVLLALCAYCGCLSPHEKEVTPDLWYEQARYGVHACIKKGSSVEMAQALLLLAMKDHGNGNETRAWLFLGLAIRVGQDMDLNGDLPTTYARKDLPMAEIRLRKNIWRIAIMLDLFLSLQLGRPPASFHSLQEPPKHDVQKTEFAKHPVPIFLHTIALSQIISRIYLLLYKGWGTPTMRTRTEKLTTLTDQLKTWYQSLPALYHVPAGDQSARQDILELNLLYHVANILLYRPFCRDEDTHPALDALIKEASAFDELLEKYLRGQNQVPTSPAQPLSFPNPNMISHIFTAAGANVAIHRIHYRRSIPKNVVVAATETFGLPTQLHLSRCLEALSSAASVWGLAQEYSETLRQLMKVEALKGDTNMTVSEPSRSSLGKRTREEDRTPEKAMVPSVGN